MNIEETRKREDVCPGKHEKLDLATARARIEKTKGPEFWRSLEELAGSDEFREMMHREFPKGASEWVDAVSRRGFMKLMGASLAMAGMTACTKQPLEPIVPYVKQPEELVPGRPMFYATAFDLAGYASPVLVESHMYRPTKVEGNEQHPAAWVERTSTPKPRFLACTTLTVRRPLLIWGTSVPGGLLYLRSGGR